MSSEPPSPPNSAASCRAARSRAGEERRPARVPPRASRRRNCRAAARTRRASASSGSAAARSSKPAGDSIAAMPAMPSSTAAGPSGAAGACLADPVRGGQAARAFGAPGTGTTPNRSVCPASFLGLRVTGRSLRASPDRANVPCMPHVIPAGRGPAPVRAGVQTHPQRRVPHRQVRQPRCQPLRGKGRGAWCAATATNSNGGTAAGFAFPILGCPARLLFSGPARTLLRHRGWRPNACGDRDAVPPDGTHLTRHDSPCTGREHDC